ncbi:MAG: hypothetical protein QXF56_04355 [Candidatus Micrarchaeia archaeon]
MVSWAEWYGITFAVISLMFGFVALAYMVGMGFHLPKLQAWAKDELYQAIASGLLAVLLLSFISTIDATMVSLYGADPFGIVSNYISMLTTSMMSFFIAIVEMDAFFGMLQSLVFKAMPTQTGFNINPFVGLAPVTSMLSLGMEAVLGGIGLLLGQGSFLTFIKTQFQILLPIGIALRAFPFSRPAGGAIIAVFLGFYIFYPFLWVFDKAIYDETIKPLALVGGARNFANALGLGSSCRDDPMSCTTNTPDFGGNMFLSLIKFVAYPAILYLFIFVIFMPMFNLIVTLVLINELAKIFGAEIDLGGLSGLI